MDSHQTFFAGSFQCFYFLFRLGSRTLTAAQRERRTSGLCSSRPKRLQTCVRILKKEKTFCALLERSLPWPPSCRSSEDSKLLALENMELIHAEFVRPSSGLSFIIAALAAFTHYSTYSNAWIQYLDQFSSLPSSKCSWLPLPPGNSAGVGFHVCIQKWEICVVSCITLDLKVFYFHVSTILLF